MAKETQYKEKFFLHDVLDYRTGELITYMETDEVSSPSQCYGVVYRWYKGRALKRQFIGFPKIEWYGGKDDNITDCSPAFETAQKELSQKSNVQYQTGDVIDYGTGRGIYYHSRTMNLKSSLKVIGRTQAKNGAYNTRLRFKGGINCVVINRYNTFGDNTATTAGSGADNSVIEGLHITQNFNTWFWTIDNNAVDSLIMGFSSPTKYSVGDRVKNIDGQLRDSNTFYITSVDSGTHILGLDTAYNNFVVGDIVTGSSTGAKGTVIFKGGIKPTLVIKAVTGTFSANEDITGSISGTITRLSVAFKANIALTVYGYRDVVGAVQLNTSLLPFDAYGSGITLVARGTVKNCVVQGVAYNGISGISSGSSRNNLNCSVIETSLIMGCGNHGIMLRGEDSNACNIIDVSSTGHCGYAIYDESFLGNYYYGVHTSISLGGAYYVNGLNNFSVLTACYSEGLYEIKPYDKPTSRLHPQVTVVGGDHGAGLDRIPIVYNRGGFGRFSGTEIKLGSGLSATVNTSGDIADKEGLKIVSSNSTGANMSLMKQANNDVDYPATIAAYQTAYSVHDSGFPDHMKIAEIRANLPNTKVAAWQFLVRKNDGQNRLTISGNAQVLPIISGGVITAIDIKYAGSGYTSPPTITGTGKYAGIVAEAEILNGSVYKINVISSPTGLAALTPIVAMNITSDNWEPATDVTTTLGRTALRFLNVFGQTLRTGAGAHQITSGTGIPEGVLTAPGGSQYYQTDGATGLKNWIKETQALNNGGWRRVVSSISGTSAQRPTLSNITYDIGIMYFDTSLQKPIWWSGTAWKDATGTAV